MEPFERPDRHFFPPFCSFLFRYSTPLNYFYSTGISLTFHHIVDMDGRIREQFRINFLGFTQRRNSSNFIEQTFPLNSLSSFHFYLALKLYYVYWWYWVRELKPKSVHAHLMYKIKQTHTFHICDWIKRKWRKKNIIHWSLVVIKKPLSYAINRRKYWHCHANIEFCT